MVTLQSLTTSQLTALLRADGATQIAQAVVPRDEEVAPKFLLKLVINKLRQDPGNRFWWAPRLVIFENRAVGMIIFKDAPSPGASVEIGYGITASQQGRGFATAAVKLMLQEAFSEAEIQMVIAHTVPSNWASQRVLEKNGFSRVGSKVDREDGEVLIWQKTRAAQP